MIDNFDLNLKFTKILFILTILETLKDFTILATNFRGFVEKNVKIK